MLVVSLPRAGAGQSHVKKQTQVNDHVGNGWAATISLPILPIIIASALLPNVRLPVADNHRHSYMEKLPKDHRIGLGKEALPPVTDPLIHKQQESHVTENSAIQQGPWLWQHRQSPASSSEVAENQDPVAENVGYKATNKKHRTRAGQAPQCAGQ